MGYEALIETLLKEGEQNSRRRVERAETEAAALLQAAEAEGARLEQEALKRLDVELQAKRGRLLDQARREGCRLLLEAKHRLLAAVFAAAEQRQRAWLVQADREEIGRFWRRRVEQALLELPQDSVRAILHRENSKELEAVLDEREIAGQKVDDPALWCGFALVSSDGRVTVTDSYRARLERLRPELLVGLQALLFSGQGSV